MNNQYIPKQSNIICHYGIPGQKWGVRNGPPYPLGQDQKSSEEKAKDPDNQGLAAELAFIIGINLAPFAIGATAAAIDSAIQKNREKRMLAKKHAGQEKDKQTGFYLKDPNKHLTEKEDLEAVNPASHDVENLKYAAMTNCMLCSMTWELRQRGYDVEARVDNTKGFLDNVKQWFPNSEIKAPEFESETRFCRDMKYPDPNSEKEQKAYRRAVTKLLNSQPDGSRGALFVNWKQPGTNNMGSGHAISYKIEKGKLVVLDPQVGKIYRGKAIETELLNNIARLQLCRLDDLEFDKKKIKEVAM